VLDDEPPRQGPPAPGLRPERPMIAHDRRVNSYEGVEIGWSKEEAEQECARCLRCDMKYPVTGTSLTAACASTAACAWSPAL
jgi:hypothetical protein